MIQKTKQLEVKELMQEKVYFVYSDQPVFDAAVLMTSKEIGTLPIIKNGTLEGILIGIITDRDIITRGIAIGKDPRRTNYEKHTCSNR